MIQQSTGRRNVRVVGLDIAIRASGVVCLDTGPGGNHWQTRLITLPKASNVEQRAQRFVSMEAELDALLSSWAPIQYAAIESYSFDSTHRMADLAEMGGVVRLLLRRHHIPFVEVPPKSLKRFVTTSGSASKARVMYAVKTHYDLDVNDDNLSDAAGLAMLANVALTRNSERRCELEVVHNVLAAHTGKKAKKKRIVRARPDAV